MQPGVLDEPAQQIRAVGAGRRYGGLGGEHDGVAPLLRPVRFPAEERQGRLGDGGRVGAHTLVHGAEPRGVVAGVGEDDVRAVAQQESVGELLVDDSDVARDDDGPAGQFQCGQTVQHRLDRTADEGEDDDVVLLVPHGVQELDRGHLAHPAGVDPHLADLGELAGVGVARPRSSSPLISTGRSAVPDSEAPERRRAVSAPHFHRVSESASTAMRRAARSAVGVSAGAAVSSVRGARPRS